MSSPSADPPSTDAGPDEAYCRGCGRVIDADARYCPDCGARQDAAASSGSALDDAVDDLLGGGNPFVAAALSAVFPGLGQIYNRELEKGLAVVVAGVLAVLSAAVLVGFLLYPAVLVYAIYDAYTVAERGAETDRVGAAAGDTDADADRTADDDAADRVDRR